MKRKDEKIQSPLLFFIIVLCLFVGCGDGKGGEDGGIDGIGGEVDVVEEMEEADAVDVSVEGLEDGGEVDAGDVMEMEPSDVEYEQGYCGNGIVDSPDEECDDGNDINDDYCTNDCKLPDCGDGAIQLGEECDDGNDNDNDGCVRCRIARCGDGYLWVGHEECDDGNYDVTDDCPMCMHARCGDGYIWAGHEDCDDGNDDPNDGCDNCHRTCSDSSECDDGNMCTEDVCDPSTGVCIHRPDNEGEVCDPGSLCTGIGTCVDGECMYSDPLDCDDDNECTDDRCDDYHGCVNEPVPEGSPCDDGFFCTGNDSCTWGGVCVGHVGVSCNDGDPCTEDICDEEADTCINEPKTYRVVNCGEGSGGNLFGAPNEMNNIACPDGTHPASNSDEVFQVEVSSAGTLTVSFISGETDAGTELYILSNGCDPSTCLGASTSSVSVPVSAGTYYILIDGGGNYAFSVECL